MFVYFNVCCIFIYCLFLGILDFKVFGVGFVTMRIYVDNFFLLYVFFEKSESCECGCRVLGSSCLLGLEVKKK